MAYTIKDILALAVKKDSSDIHILTDSVPVLRTHGVLEFLTEAGVVSSELAMEMITSIMSPNQREIFLRELELDFSLSLLDGDRFRINAYFQRGTPAMSLRYIPDTLFTIEDLGLPPICHGFAKLKQGFVLVTGPTGSGKSSTFSAIIDEINATRAEHVITVEDPIEFVHKNKKSIISQRELGGDTKSWNNALKSVLREDPNVVYIGEMRDLDTMSAAMTTAETGHLVFATLHTNSAAQTVERIVDSFPQSQQEQITLQLSLVLEAVLSQRLIPSRDGKRVVATEIMIATPAVRNNIREGKSFQIDNVIQTSSNLGMKLMEQSLAELVAANKVDRNVAMEYAIRPAVLDRLLGSI